MAFVVAIDGPAGAGKSTAARRVASELGLTYLDTGAMYRAVAWKALRDGIALNDEAGLVRAAGKLELEFSALAPDGTQNVFVAGEDVTSAIRTPEVSQQTSRISAYPGVRRVIVERQRRIGERAPEGVVLEGRDIGTVVFPDATLKVFLTASPQERARRRIEELTARGIAVDPATVLAEQIERDTRDSERQASPLTAAADAVPLNTDGLSIDAVVDRILELCRARMARPRETGT